MNGEIAWSALEVVGELVGVTDPERLVRGLVQIREWQRETQDKG